MMDKLDMFKHFNSHPHEEDDKAELKEGGWYKYFNSHPHEEDDDA